MRNNHNSRVTTLEGLAIPSTPLGVALVGLQTSNPIYKFTTSVCPSVTEVLGGGGRGVPVEAAGDKRTVRFL
jgi:hypothetical protein